VNVGRIGTLVDLGKISIRGDLGALEAGDTTPETPAVTMVQVTSYGRGGVTTDGGTIQGRIPLFMVTNDFAGNLHLIGSAGIIDKLVIGGSLAGLPGLANSGHIEADGGFGSVKIASGIRGTDAAGTGVLKTVAGLKTLFVSGGMTAGSGSGSGRIDIGASAGKMQFGGGAMGSLSGKISVGGSLDVLTIGGSVVGPVEIGGSVKMVTIAGSIGDRDVSSAGFVTIGGSAGTVRVLGSLVNDGGFNSGILDVGGSAKTVFVGGGVQGGRIFIGGNLNGLTITGDIVGTDSGGGFVSVTGDAGSVRIGGDILGGPGGSGGGALILTKSVKTLAVLGSVRGGDGFQAGSVRVDGAAGAVFIGGDILGGEGGSDAGSLRFGATMSALTIGGSIRGGDDGGEVLIIGNTKSVLIRGSILAVRAFSRALSPISGTWPTSSFSAILCPRPRVDPRSASMDGSAPASSAAT
jgi:hypothetical protein